MQQYALFVQDVGKKGYSRSGWGDVHADSPADAIRRRVPNNFWARVLALPVDRKDLWPDGKTGLVPAEALTFDKTMTFGK